MRRVILFLFLVLLSVSLTACGKNGDTVALIPLDSRPINTSEVEAFAAMTDNTFILPEAALLDDFTTPAKSDDLFAWLEAQDADRYIIYTNELFNGSLIASRNLDSYQHLETKIDRLTAWLKDHKDKGVTVVTILPRHLPSQFDPALAPYAAALADWSSAAHNAAVTGKAPPPIPTGVPPEAVKRYRDLYEASGALIQALIPLTETGLIDRYYISIDDYAPYGLATEWWQMLKDAVGTDNYGKTSFIKGADELSIMLAARTSQPPSESSDVQIQYTSEDSKDDIPPYEGEPLSETVAEKIAFLGLEECAESKNILLIHNDPGNANAVESFLDAHPDAHIALADVAYTNKGDAALWPLLNKRPKNLVAYSGWNTAANSIGTAAAWLAVESQADAAANETFLTLRLAQDQAYLALLAPKLRAHWQANGKIDGFGIFTSPENQAACEKELNGAFHTLWADTDMAAGSLHFPWARSFEVSFQPDRAAN